MSEENQDQPQESTNLLSLIQGMDADKVGDVLKQFEKYEKVIDKASGMVMRLNRIGVLPAVMRVVGAKTGMGEEINKPLPQQSELEIKASSATHLYFYKQLNNQPEEAINKMLQQAIIEGEKQQRKADKEAKKK